MAGAVEKVKQPRGALLFREVQRIRQPWIWALLLICCVLLVGIFGYGMYKQLILGEPWGTNPMPDLLLLVMGTFFILFALGMLWFFGAVRLVTEVRTDGIYVRFVPLFRNYVRIPFEKIRQYQARQYSPVREYGGWGIRYSRSGKAYNLSGNQGLQLILEDGSRLLIGTQRPEELERAVHEAVR